MVNFPKATLEKQQARLITSGTQLQKDLHEFEKSKGVQINFDALESLLLDRIVDNTLRTSDRIVPVKSSNDYMQYFSNLDIPLKLFKVRFVPCNLKDAAPLTRVVIGFDAGRKNVVVLHAYYKNKQDEMNPEKVNLALREYLAFCESEIDNPNNFHNTTGLVQDRPEMAEYMKEAVREQIKALMERGDEGYLLLLEALATVNPMGVSPLEEIKKRYAFEIDYLQELTEEQEKELVELKQRLEEAERDKEEYERKLAEREAQKQIDEEEQSQPHSAPEPEWRNNEQLHQLNINVSVKIGMVST